MDLKELKKMKESMETAARDVEQTVQTTTSDFEKDWADTTAGITADLPELTGPTPPRVSPRTCLSSRRLRPHTKTRTKIGVSSVALYPSGTRRVRAFAPKPFLGRPVWRVTGPSPSTPCEDRAPQVPFSNLIRHV